MIFLHELAVFLVISSSKKNIWPSFSHPETPQSQTPPFSWVISSIIWATTWGVGATLNHGMICPPWPVVIGSFAIHALATWFNGPLHCYAHKKHSRLENAHDFLSGCISGNSRWGCSWRQLCLLLPEGVCWDRPSKSIGFLGLQLFFWEMVGYPYPLKICWNPKGNGRLC